MFHARQVGHLFWLNVFTANNTLIPVKKIYIFFKLKVATSEKIRRQLD